MAIEIGEKVYQLQRVAIVATLGKLEQVYQEAMNALRLMLEVDNGSLQLLRDDGLSLEFVATVVPDELPKLQELGPIVVNDQSISGFVTKHGEPLLLSDSWQDSRFGERQRRIAEDEGVGNRSYICVPLKTREKTIGVLNVVHREPNVFSEEDLRTLTILATFVTISIQNAKQVEELLEAHQIQENMEYAITMADLTNNFSHTINNELGLVGTYVSQLERRLSVGKLDDNFLREKLSLIKDAANNTTELVSNMKKFDQVIKGESINLRECLDEAIFKLRLVPEKDVLIVSSSDDVHVYATRQLTEVFINLLRNSWDAMQSSSQKRVIIAYDKSSDKYLTVKVTDTGPGVPSQIKDRIFNLGMTTKSKGIGYGLWWVRTWLHRRGGDITYDETFKDGARFIIKLPLALNSEE